MTPSLLWTWRRQNLSRFSVGGLMQTAGGPGRDLAARRISGQQSVLWRCFAGAVQTAWPGPHPFCCNPGLGLRWPKYLRLSCSFQGTVTSSGLGWQARALDCEARVLSDHIFSLEGWVLHWLCQQSSRGCPARPAVPFAWVLRAPNSPRSSFILPVFQT